MALFHHTSGSSSGSNSGSNSDDLFAAPSQAECLADLRQYYERANELVDASPDSSALIDFFENLDNSLSSETKSIRAAAEQFLEENEEAQVEYDAWKEDPVHEDLGRAPRLGG